MESLRRYLSRLGVALVGLFLLPEMAMAGRVAKIAEALSGGGDEKLRQLITIGIYAALFFLLLLLLHLVQQHKGAKRFMVVLTLLIYGGVFLILHMT